MSKPTKSEKEHMERVSEIGCIICKMPANVHHCGTHLGGGRDHKRVIPLCHIHHQNGGYGVALHAGKKAWESVHGTEQELIKKTNSLLALTSARLVLHQ